MASEEDIAKALIMQEYTDGVHMHRILKNLVAIKYELKNMTPDDRVYPMIDITEDTFWNAWIQPEDI